MSSPVPSNVPGTMPPAMPSDMPPVVPLAVPSAVPPTVPPTVPAVTQSNKSTIYIQGSSFKGYSSKDEYDRQHEIFVKILRTFGYKKITGGWMDNYQIPSNKYFNKQTIDNLFVYFGYNLFSNAYWLKA